MPFRKWKFKYFALVQQIEKRIEFNEIFNLLNFGSQNILVIRFLYPIFYKMNVKTFTLNLKITSHFNIPQQRVKFSLK